MGLRILCKTLLIFKLKNFLWSVVGPKEHWYRSQYCYTCEGYSILMSLLFHFKETMLAVYLFVQDFACHIANSNGVRSIAYSFSICMSPNPFLCMKFHFIDRKTLNAHNKCITLFKSITMFCGTDIIQYNIL